MSQNLSRGPELDRGNLQAHEEDSGQVERSDQETSAELCSPLCSGVIGEADGKVQEEGRLERCCRYSSPVDDPVEGVELGRVVEGAYRTNETRTEDIKMGRFGSRPPTEEDVDSDTEIDQSDEAEAQIDGTIFGLEDDLYVKFRRVFEVGGVRGWSKDGIGDLGKDATTEGFANKWGKTVSRPVIDGDEDIAFSDTCSLAGGVEGNMFRSKASLRLDPPDTVGRNFEAILALEVHSCEHACNHSR